MNKRPKTFVAAVDFSCATAHFKAGDPVTGVALATALGYGDRFVVPEREASKSKTTNTPQPAVTVETEGD